MSGDLLDELERYFGGELHAAMGVRSPLGAAILYGTALGRSQSSPAEPDGFALSAARVVDRVEAALEEIGPTHRAVLAAAYAPRTSWTRMMLRVLDDRSSPRELGSVPAVVCLLEDAAELAELVERCRLRGKPNEGAREQAQSELARCRGRAKGAVQAARSAYLEAAIAVRRRRREERTKRFRRGILRGGEEPERRAVVAERDASEVRMSDFLGSFPRGASDVLTNDAAWSTELVTPAEIVEEIDRWRAGVT